MGFVDKIKKMAGIEDESYDDNNFYDSYDNYDTLAQEAPAEEKAAPVAQAAVAPTRATGTNVRLSGNSLEMKVVKPEHFDSASQIADHLLNGRTVVLNLENTNKETARRLIDFLSGVAYSIDGALKKIASNAYVITPNNVDVGEADLEVMGELEEEVPEEEFVQF